MEAYGMTIHPKYEQFTANGNVRTADLLKSIATLIRRRKASPQSLNDLAGDVENLAMTIEADECR